MNKDSKSIFKMQEAGSVPEVNQYGLTEEQMQSVRDNMRRYGLSEEEAVANKIKAMNRANKWRRKLYRSLGGMYRVTADKLDSQLTPMQKERYKFKTSTIVDDFHNTANNFYRSVKYDPYWKIKANQEVDKLKWDFANTARASRDYAHMLVGYKGPFSSYSPDALRIAESIKRGNYRNNRDYEKYVQEYLDKNPHKYNFFADNYHTMSPNSAATMDRVQAAHDYAIAKLKEQWDRDKELANISDYNYQRHLENAYHPDYEKYNPHNQWMDAFKKTAAVGGSAMLTLSMLPWLGSEVTTYGLLGAVPRIAGGFIGSELGIKGAGYIGKQADNVLGTKWIEPISKFAGMLAGWRKGEGLGYTGALKGTRFGMNLMANNMMRNGAYNVTFQPKRWLIGNQMQTDLKLMNLGWDPIKNPINLYNIASAYRRPNPYTMIAAPAYRSGGILKKQTGGLIYKPFFPEVNTQSQDVQTISYEPDDTEEEQLQVEPVKIYQRTIQQDMNPVQEEQEIVQTPVQDTTVQDEGSEITKKEIDVLYNDGSNEEKRKVSIKYLQQNLNLTKEQAAAIVGQWQRESHFKLNAENKEEKAGKNTDVKSSKYGIGIGQWTGQRHDAFVEYVNTHGGVANLKTQLDFAINEIKSNHEFLNNLRNAKTIEDASAYVYTQYVAAQHKNIKDLDDLYSKAKVISEKYKKKHKELYGRSSDTFDAGIRYAIDSLKLK